MEWSAKLNRHPFLNACATLACLPPWRRVTRSVLRRLSSAKRLTLKQKQQAFNLLATKASKGIVSVETDMLVPGNGQRLRVQLNLDEDLDRKWFYWGYGGYEPESVAALWQLAMKRKYVTVLEVGANIGFFFAFVRRCGTTEQSEFQRPRL